MTERKFKISFRHLYPIILSLGVSSALTYPISVLNPELPALAFFAETAHGIALNASIFVILMAVAATFLYLLIKLGLHKMAKNLIKLALVLSTFFVVLWYGEALLPLSGSLRLLFTALAFAVTVALSHILFSSKGLKQVFAALLTGSLVGVFLGASVPHLTALALLVALSVYDTISVYKGPIGKIAEKTRLEEFTGAVFTYKNLVVGMGDVVFYSMLISNVLLNLGLYPYVGAMVGVLAGAYLAFKMLEKREMFPGLPPALLLGLALALLASRLT
ncbi:TPA: hypothetical protein EYP26_06120 [Candidatus Bathyarchaeota archaeon]|nr:hypothetical protein [Candidatus Bathyarchaeota archaeon]